MNKRATGVFIVAVTIILMCGYYLSLRLNVGNYQTLMDLSCIFGCVAGLLLAFLPGRRLVPAGSFVLISYLPAWYFGLKSWEAHSYRNVLFTIGPEVGLKFGIAAFCVFIAMSLFVTHPPFKANS